MKNLIQPFTGLRPQKQFVSDVIAPPYDVVTTESARELAKDNERHFLHLTRAEIDLPDDTDPYNAAVYQQAKLNFQAMLDEQVLMHDDAPSYYVYEMAAPDMVQQGLVVAASVDAYCSGDIKIHEYTRPDKEQDRIAHLTAVEAQLSPVLMCYRDNDSVTQMIHAATSTTPLYQDVQLADVRHTLWRIADEQHVAQLTESFNALDKLYIADGHHRSAASAEFAKLHPDAKYQHFLAVVFPESQLKIAGYHRLLKDLNGHTDAEFLALLNKQFDLQPVDSPVLPTQAFEYGMYLSGQWYHLHYKTNAKTHGLLQDLDVSILQDHVITPLLDITDVRTDARISFVGGVDSIDTITTAVDSKRMRLGFTLPATQTQQLFDVADAGMVMPPKSTWFEPKLADGLIALDYSKM